MFESTRPDAKNALELENVKKALLRYREILLGREKARFIIARENSLLKKKVDEAYNILKSCELCERRCHVNRAEGKLGICKVGNKPLISSAFQHWGEEPFFVPSFTIFLKDIIDVYLSDWKYWNNECAERLSKVKNYLEIVRRNHDLAFKDSEMVIRHLVLPNHFECCTKNILKYIADNYGEKVIVNVMDQYRPVWKAHLYPEISRSLTESELKKAVNYAEDLGLNFIT